MDLYNASMGMEEPQEIELTHEQYVEAKEHYETIIARGESAKRLADNPDFKSLVIDGYLDDEPKRIAELMASGRLTAQSMEACTMDLRAVGSFRNYMKMFVEQGGMAAAELAALEEARDLAIKEAEEAEQPDPLGR